MADKPSKTDKAAEVTLLAGYALGVEHFVAELGTAVLRATGKG